MGLAEEYSALAAALGAVTSDSDLTIKEVVGAIIDEEARIGKPLAGKEAALLAKENLGAMHLILEEIKEETIVSAERSAPGLRDWHELPDNEARAEEHDSKDDTVLTNPHAQLQAFFQNLLIEAAAQRDDSAMLGNDFHEKEAPGFVGTAASSSDGIVELEGSDADSINIRQLEASRLGCCLATTFDSILSRAPTRARQLSMVASDNLPFQEDWPNVLGPSNSGLESLAVTKILAGLKHLEA
ncbi:hypothetical protein SISNIDRAFT_487260 [Sistotremastrum niveocremeum HHB9708]|uniref:Uncharacterized protein n=1 Tax=Sistotremastrum niveocremeum HHB9708 TaxID=1314777 RepID=A0A164SL78_9AGAM|nr:hypothetical protein SISNIDRAFT_487260 [Sistotremastrum niveocremeum HHB9708]